MKHRPQGGVGIKVPPFAFCNFFPLPYTIVIDPPLDTSVQQLDECLYSHAISYVPNSPAVYEQAKTIISDYLVAAGQKKRQHRVGWCRRRLGAAFYTLKTLVPGHTLTNELSLPSMGPLGLPPPLLYFDCHVPILLDLFSQTHPQQGLSLHALPALQQHYGINTLPLVTKPKASTLLYHQMTDLMILILLAAAIVEAAQKDFDSMVILLVVVALSTTIGFTQEWKACQTLFAMMDLSQPMVGTSTMSTLSLSYLLTYLLTRQKSFGMETLSNYLHVNLSLAILCF